jgi:hypothetical protein
MERCVHNKIYPSLSSLINTSQHGFLKNHPCITQLVTVLHDIGKNLDSNKVDMIYLDFSKAFDSIDHAILLQQLHMHGIKGSLLLWFKDYLTDRFQCVVLDNVASDWFSVTSGMPQGSILGYSLSSSISCLTLYSLDQNLPFMLTIQKYINLSYCRLTRRPFNKT